MLQWSGGGSGGKWLEGIVLATDDEATRGVMRTDLERRGLMKMMMKDEEEERQPSRAAVSGARPDAE